MNMLRGSRDRGGGVDGPPEKGFIRDRDAWEDEAEAEVGRCEETPVRPEVGRDMVGDGNYENR